MSAVNNTISPHQEPVGAMYTKVQRPLSKFQALPIIGPALGSPIKLVVSIIQAVGGLLAAMVAKPIAKCTGSESVGKFATKALAHARVGGEEALFSIVNMLTLGLFGYIFEKGLGITKNLEI